MIDCAGKEGKEQGQKKYTAVSFPEPTSQPCEKPAWWGTPTFTTIFDLSSSLLVPNEIATDERLYLYHPLGISPTTWIEFSSSFPFYILLPTTARWAIQRHCAHHEGALLKHTQWQVQSPLQMVFLKLPRKALLRSTWLLPWSRFHPPNKISCF